MKILERHGSTIFYGDGERAYRLEATGDMCSITLGEKRTDIYDSVGYAMQPVQVVELVWVYPSPDELSDEDAALVALEHHGLSEPLSVDEMEEYALTNVKYLFYLEKHLKSL